jgi:L-gulono-1,4-lactone dehydrogenase
LPKDVAMPHCRVAKITSKSWTNWGGNVTAQPSHIVRPGNEAALVDAVRSAIATGNTIKAVGAGHSFTSIAKAEETLIDLSGYQRVVRANTSTGEVTVQSGMTLKQLNFELDRIGLALANMGDIAYQSIAGAISTGTHGTGRTLGGISPQVIGMRIIDGLGNVHDCRIGGTNHDIASAARVGLGALGVLSEVSLQCVPAFALKAVTEPMKVEKLLGELPRLCSENDHFEFFWVPHTKWALTKTNNRTDEPLKPRSKLSAFTNDYLLENYAFGAVCALGKRVPKLIPRLATALPSSGRVEYTDKSYEVFASPRLVKFLEQEYSIPVAALPDALREIMAMVDQDGFRISFPVEVRFTPPDDVPLSTSSGRASAYIAVHMTKGTPHDAYFAAVERIVNRYDGRPHWGKLHTRCAHDLSQLYPQWNAFQVMRSRLDPNGVFANEYLDRVLGPIGHR